jgi:haloalkane dehalogenase
LFDRLVLLNTQLPTLDEGESEWFNKFRAMVIGAEEFPVGKMVNDGVPGQLSAEAIAGFDAPFPDQSYKTGPRSFPMIHPITEYDASIEPNRAAWAALANFDKPVLTVFSEMVAKTAMPPAQFHDHIPGAKGQPHVVLPGGGFYVVEAKPVEVAQHIIDFVRSTSS